MPIASQNAGRDAAIAWAVVAALVTVLVRVDIQLPAIGHLGSLIREVTRPKPWRASWRRTISRIGMSPIGTSGFGNDDVNGRSRVPSPPARTTA